MASSKPQSPTVLEELFSAADDVLGDFCDEIVSLAESLLPQLQRYLAWEVDSFGPMVPVRIDTERLAVFWLLTSQLSLCSSEGMVSSECVDTRGRYFQQLLRDHASCCSLAARSQNPSIEFIPSSVVILLLQQTRSSFVVNEKCIPSSCPHNVTVRSKYVISVPPLLLHLDGGCGRRQLASNLRLAD